MPSIRAAVAAVSAAVLMLTAGFASSAAAEASPVQGLSFTVDTTTVDSTDPYVNLTFTFSAPTSSVADLHLSTGTRTTKHWCHGVSQNACVLTLRREIPEDQTVTFTAKLTQSGVPDQSLGSVTVTHAGWPGVITAFDAVRDGSTGFGDARFRLIAETSAPLSGYELSVFSISKGRLVSECSRDYQTFCGPFTGVPEGTIAVYEAVVSSGGYAGGGEYSGRVPARATTFAYSGDIESLVDDLARYALVALTQPPASMSARALAIEAASTSTSAAMQLNDTAACGRFAPYLRANPRTRSTAGDFWLTCNSEGLGVALKGLASIVSIGTIIAIIQDMAVDPDAPLDADVDPSADCFVLLSGPATWCTENADDAWLNPGQPTAADYDGAVNSPTAYSTPDKPWDPKPLRPRFTCFDGTEAWSCDGIPGEPREIEIYVLEDGEWEPQASRAGSKPPTNCMFLDANGDLLLDDDGRIDTSVRDEKLDQLLRQDGLENTYERHHIVTRHANASNLAKVELVNRMRSVIDSYSMGIDDGLNIIVIPHEGPHPAEYHQWVLQNLQMIDDDANGSEEVFRELFRTRISDVIRTDPSIVLGAYWRCRR
ncbi:AHH domain-containing protein [Demequina muriae]|uniref:AHH domain-containing protein n=1 Tax=Demequina muriae TaxID=3051664 RepID=A0ABT8GG27_9MICO|nr:AHH domain-containing protein [Demequina sp. EGI L300058]MDN4480386.1 AHH domain-containing protein [Demequina sp. EGI L300058]